MKVLWGDNTEVSQDELTEAQWDSINKLHTRFSLPDTLRLSRGYAGEYVMVADISIRRDGRVGGRVFGIE